MPRKDLNTPNVSPASRHGKRGWLTVSGLIPPNDFDRLDRLATRRDAKRSHLIAEAVTEYLDRQAA